MRVGIALPTSPENAGGAYTFERDVLESLAVRTQASMHQFALLSTSDAAPGACTEKLPHLVLPPAQAPTSATRALHAVRRRFRGGPSSAPTDRTARFLREQSIEAIIHLSPWQLLSSEVPYLTFVWDLEHRVQPYFPELGSASVFAHREQHFRRVLPRAAAIVTGTQEGQRQIETFYGVAPERIHILPHPTPRDALRLAAQRTGERRAPDAPRLLYPAQLWPHKNHVGLLHALRHLRDRFSISARLLLAGADHGGLRAHIESSARALGVAEQVEFLGFLPRARLLELYTEVSMLVYPSTFGPENLPPLEAFALGCPVVASRVPGAEEQLADAALLFDTHDERAMSACIQAVLTDPKVRARLVQAGLERARRWTGDQVADGLLRWVDDFARVRRLWP